MYLNLINKAKTNRRINMYKIPVYIFAMWDAFKDIDDETEPYSFLPFVFEAYFVTIGLIYLIRISVFGILIRLIYYS